MHDSLQWRVGEEDRGRQEELNVPCEFLVIHEYLCIDPISWSILIYDKVAYHGLCGAGGRPGKDRGERRANRPVMVQGY